MENKERVPIIEKEINFSYSKGMYRIFTQTCAKLFAIVVAILSSAKGLQLVSCTGEKARALVSCLWIVHHNKRKLAGIDSISTSVHDNCICAAYRKIKDCICQLCYAFNQQAFQTGLREHNIINGLVLRNVLIPVSAFKALAFIYPYIRIESFGDVANVIQARNYLRIIKAFPGKRCAIWSKSAAIWDKAIKAEGKPKNTTFVLSSPYLNKPIAKTILENFPFIDHVFTVYTKSYARKNNIVINCGGRKCLDCILKKKACYYRNTEFYINELQK